MHSCRPLCLSSAAAVLPRPQTPAEWLCYSWEWLLSCLRHQKLPPYRALPWSLLLSAAHTDWQHLPRVSGSLCSALPGAAARKGTWSSCLQSRARSPGCSRLFFWGGEWGAFPHLQLQLSREESGSWLACVQETAIYCFGSARLEQIPPHPGSLLPRSQTWPGFSWPDPELGVWPSGQNDSAKCWIWAFGGEASKCISRGSPAPSTEGLGSG